MAKNIDFMMGMVKDYLAGKMPRYKKMAREDRDYAEYFYDMLSEDGVDAGDGLSDTEFKQLIRKQYNKVKSIADDGFY